jgi:tripartite tricarboxylate transporter TctB family protein
MTVRRDHVGGLAFIVAGALILAVSGDLPFGTLASPGAGMLPKLVIGLMMAFGVILLLRGGDSPLLAETAWADLPHATRVVAISAAGIALYTTLGFFVTMSLLLFGLTFAVERRPILNAALFSVGVAGIAYLLFNTLLKSPLPRGVLWF